MEESPVPRSRTPILIIAGLAIAIGLAALVFALTRSAPRTATAEVAVNQSDSATELAETASPTGWTISSGVPTVKVALLSELPIAPPCPTASATYYCDGDAPPPEPGTPQGRIAANRGWQVASEGHLGPLTAIVIVSGYQAGTSGAQFAQNGNIALFDGDRLVAVVYADKRADFQIGAFQVQGPGLRFGTGAPGAPIADLTVQGRAIRVAALAPSDSVCAGRHTVPNIYRLTIPEARRRLMAAGWKPVPSTDEAEFLTADLRNQGVVEVNSCVPTGYGQCDLSYAAGSDRLSVGTVGDVPPHVTDYSVECH